MKLYDAMNLAERIQRELAPFCRKCDIAGSIRRARPEVNDIDLVVLAKEGQERALRDRCKANAEQICDGLKMMSVRLKNGMRVDVYFAAAPSEDLLERKPTNYGAIMMTRTGSREHNIKLIGIAKRQDKEFKPGEGVFAGGLWELEGQDSVYRGGTLIASETEEQIFEALGMQWVAPALREVAFNPGLTIPEILNQEASR